ncbi:glycosyltransferase [Larkinella bovis]|uniref:Glycosyltransferase n=1 Tax=Larkinella bovis TaxID=683041 RepID=A0ABW0IGF7_9BACT
MQHKLNILVSAYACEPNKGSEPGIGWNWIVQIAERGHLVWVLTRRNNKENIEKYGIQLGSNVNFIYYDLPKPVLHLKKFLGVHLYYILWQLFVLPISYKKHKIYKFDIIHHITFGVFRHCSFLWLLNTKFIIGPVGGGELAPWPIIKELDFKSIVFEVLRYFSNITAKYSPLLNLMYAYSWRIYVKTPETTKFISKKFSYKIRTAHDIGVTKTHSDNICSTTTERFQILYMGRFLHWKGIHLALKAFYLLIKSEPDAKFILIGSGNYRDKLIKLANSLQIPEYNIEWISWIDHTSISTYYLNSKIFLFPSLHDSSGTVVFEALSFGLPVVCLNLGGPPLIIGNEMDTIISVEKKSQEEIINLIMEKLLEIATNKTLYLKLKEKAFERANQLIWRKVVSEVYDDIEVAASPKQISAPY